MDAFNAALCSIDVQATVPQIDLSPSKLTELCRTQAMPVRKQDRRSIRYIAASNLPGLHLEGATPQELYDQLPGAIEDLLEGSGQREVSFDFITPVEIMPGRVKIAA